MNRVMNLMVFAVCLLAGAANAATGSSGEFRIDLRGMGPWERRVARPTETISYSSAWATDAPAGAKAVVKVYPCLKEKPKYIAIDLSGGTTATRYPIEYLDEIPGGNWSDEYKTSKLVLRHIPAGSFIMGGRNTDYPGAVNTNLHMVTLTRDFYMGVFEVTQRQWELVMGTRPSQVTNALYYAKRPVDTISWEDVRGAGQVSFWPLTKSVADESFMGRLRAKTAINGFDLPTEAQWEYAARAGVSSALSTGKNLSDQMTCDELAEVSRYSGNSGWWEHSRTWSETFANADLSLATAEVGMYLPNRWGLFDVHGNVWELILDWTWDRTGSVDPVGARTGTNRGCKGGSWSSNRGYYLCFSLSGNDPPTARGANLGLRLCLHGGEIPDLTAGQMLVEADGASSVHCTSAQSGTYLLTHEVQKDGAAVGETYSAIFDVNGPTLSLSANGELEPGVGIEVKPSFAKATEGDSGEWTIYYSLDGSESTAASTVYSGAITLNETTTVRAVAINAQGVRSEEASATFTLHDPLGIASAVATPRFPWNGKVDVDVELKGNSESKYLVEVEARDLVGGTNLPVRTVGVGRADPSAPQTMVVGGVLTGDCGGQGLPALPPGSYRLTWDAAADIAGDYDFARVAVTVKATGSHLLAYPKTLELTVAGYAGAETLADVPTLVRLSTAIEGFSYDDFATTNGSDLAFFTEDGRSLPYEIDEWNVGGESLVWVKLPTLANGTRFAVAWGKDPSIHGREQDEKSAQHEVWREYAGVWHMNEPSGTAFDSTEHHLDGIPSCGTNTLADVSQMVAYENGACGRARVNAERALHSATYMTVPSYDALQLCDSFVISGWFYENEYKAELHPRLFGRKRIYNDLNGFEVEHKNSADSLHVRGSGGEYGGVPTTSMPVLTDGWASLTFAFHGGFVDCYTNGIVSATAEITPVVDNSLHLTIGNRVNGSVGSFAGQYDEIRLRGGSFSAERIKADYDMIANREFLSYGAVRSGCEEAVK